jgi:hypothetical protein
VYCVSVPRAVCQPSRAARRSERAALQIRSTRLETKHSDGPSGWIPAQCSDNEQIFAEAASRKTQSLSVAKDIYGARHGIFNRLMECREISKRLYCRPSCGAEVDHCKRYCESPHGEHQPWCRPVSAACEYNRLHPRSEMRFELSVVNVKSHSTSSF